MLGTSTDSVDTTLMQMCGWHHEIILLLIKGNFSSRNQKEVGCRDSSSYMYKCSWLTKFTLKGMMLLAEKVHTKFILHVRTHGEMLLGAVYMVVYALCQPVVSFL